MRGMEFDVVSYDSPMPFSVNFEAIRQKVLEVEQRLPMHPEAQVTKREPGSRSRIRANQLDCHAERIQRARNHFHFQRTHESPE